VKRRTAFLYILFLVATLVVLELVEKTMDYFIKYDYDKKAACAASGSINADILVAGASRVIFGMNTKLLQKKTGLSCYNLGIPNSLIYEHLAVLDLYLKHNTRPKYLFLEVTPIIYDPSEIVFHSFHYAPYLDDEFVSSIIRKNDFLEYCLHYIPLFKYSVYNSKSLGEFISGAYRKINHIKALDSSLGYRPRDCGWDNKFDTFVKRNPNGVRYQLDYYKVKALIEYINLAKQNNIKVFLYEAPIWKGALPYYKNHDSIVNVIKNIVAKHGVSYISFADIQMSSNKAYFTNSTHLCSNGVDKFTEIFYEAYADRFRKPASKQ
jgi:hypothetical protein